MKKSLMVVLALGLAGCASTSQELAMQGQWQQLGYQDGVKGVRARTLQSLQTLGKVNINDYDDGYQQGVAEYCHSNHAYQIGLSGQDYHGVCDGQPDGNKFRMEWQRGWDRFNQ